MKCYLDKSDGLDDAGDPAYVRRPGWSAQVVLDGIDETAVGIKALAYACDACHVDFGKAPSRFCA